MEEVKIYDGCLGVWEEDTDFLLDGVDADGLPPLFTQDEEIYEYNQAKQDRSTKSCTIFNAVGAISDLMNYEFTLDQIKEIDDLSYTKGRIQGRGRYTKKAVDLATKRRNSNKELVKKYWKVAYYRVDMRNDQVVQKVLDKLYDICWGYDGNYKYGTDFTADWVLDGYDFGEKTYGHSVNIRKIWDSKGVKDSYKGRTYKGEDRNKYKVKPLFSEEVAGGTFHTRGYVITKVSEDNYEELIRLAKMRTAVNKALESHSELRHLSNDKKYQDRLHNINETHRKKLQDIDREREKHT